MVSHASSHSAIIASLILRPAVRSRIEERVLRQLLRDRAAPLAHAAAAQVMPGGAYDAVRIDPPVRIETPVLDREERLDDVRRQVLGIDRRPQQRATPRDRGAVVRGQRDRGRSRRLERFRQRRGDRQPPDRDDQQDQQRRQPAQEPAPAAGAPARRRGRFDRAELGELRVPILEPVVQRDRGAVGPGRRHRHQRRLCAGRPWTQQVVVAIGHKLYYRATTVAASIAAMARACAGATRGQA